MHIGKLTLAALFAFCLVFSGQQANAQDKDKKDDKKDETAYTVVVKKVKVETTNKDGKSWDINDGKPDLCVIIRNVDEKDSKAWKSETKDDVFEAEFNVEAKIRFRAGQRLEFQVVDVDVAANDEIGRVTKIMADESIKKGKLRIEKFDRVIYLDIEVKKL